MTIAGIRVCRAPGEGESAVLFCGVMSLLGQYRVIAAFGAIVAAVPAAAELDPTEQAIVAWVDGQAADAEALIERLVNINSGTMNPAGVRAVGDILGAELAELGFAVEWIDMPAQMNRAGHLFARRSGDRGSRVLMIGHLDTVFERDDAFQTFVREGDWASGPGTEDMKGGNVVILYALGALAAVGALEGTQIVVAYSGDEESPGDPHTISRRDLIEAGKWADVALEFESSVQDDEAEWATISRRSSSEWRLEVRGKQAHSSQIFGEQYGAGAIYEAARILTAFYTTLRGEQYLTFNAGTIVGGTDVEHDSETTRGAAFGKTNVIPSRAVVHGDMRTISNEQLARARAAMQAIVAESLPHTEASITFVDGYPAMAPSDGNRRLQQMLSDINVALGRDAMPALDPSRRGAADISFVAPYADGLAGLGPYGEGGHSPNERVDLSSLPLVIKRAAILLYRLTR
jgi:glutamate carboxypeptidase